MSPLFPENTSNRVGITTSTAQTPGLGAGEGTRSGAQGSNAVLVPNHASGLTPHSHVATGPNMTTKKRPPPLSKPGTRGQLQRVRPSQANKVPSKVPFTVRTTVRDLHGSTGTDSLVFLLSRTPDRLRRLPGRQT